MHFSPSRVNKNNQHVYSIISITLSSIAPLCVRYYIYIIFTAHFTVTFHFQTDAIAYIFLVNTSGSIVL